MCNQKNSNIMSVKIKPAEGGSRKNRGCMWAIIVCAVLYFGSIICVSMMMGSMFGGSSAKLDDKTVYRLDLKGVLVEQAKEDNPLAAFTSSMPYGRNNVETVGLDDLLSNITLAKDDERVKGIYLKGGELSVSPASAKVLRDALLDFKESGKWIIAYAESYGQMNYYIASVADKIYLDEIGAVSWHGLAGTKGYYKRILDKIGVEMQVLKVGTFKSAVEPFFRTSMSDADRKQTEVYLYGIWNNMTAAVSEARNIPVEKLNAYADEYMDVQPQQKYIEYGLIDSLIYRQDMDTILKNLIGDEDYTILNTSKMASVERKKNKAKDKIAVVYAEGEITDETGDGIVGTKMLKTLNKVLKNDEVKAMVFRVNSPGGSADASEQINHAVKLIQEKGIPVVVSMGDYAASGGYYISSEADYIYAEPTTLTGSIGIFGLIPNYKGIREKIGYDIDEVSTNKHAALQVHMTMQGMDPSEYALMQNMIERGYDLFTRRCAEGRHMSQDSIKAIGEGRVWLGQDALRLGLVDDLGNINDAIAKAAQLAELDDYALVYYPKPVDPFEEFMKMLDNSTDEEKMIARLREMVKEPRILMLAPVVEIK